MAHTCLPDFIITKKRKRSRLQAIDPCLGFYPASSSFPRDDLYLVSSPVSADPDLEEIAHTLNRHLTPLARTQPDPVHDVYRRPIADHLQSTRASVSSAGGDPTRVPPESQATLTVESFLRSAATVTTKRYRRRRGGRNVAKESEPPSHECQQIKWTSDDEDYVPEKPAKKRQRRKKSQSLSARLLAAAVVTGVDVVGGLLFPDPPEARTSTMRPLPLSVGGRAPSPINVAKSRRRRFIDPRKIDRAVSQFARAVEDPDPANKYRKPITAWKPQDHAVIGLQSRATFEKETAGLGECFKTRPLTLISSAHPRSAYQARCTTIISRNRPIPKKRKTENQRRELGLPLERSRARSIGTLPTAPGNSVLPEMLPHASPVFGAPFRSERCYSDGRTQSTSISNPDVTPSPDTNISAAVVAVPPSPTSSPLASSSNLDEVSPSHASEGPSSGHKLDPLIALPPRPLPPKPLKPLGSLLDGLRDIARKATQMANASQAHQAMRSRPDTSSKQNGYSGPGRSTYYPSGSARSRPSTAQPGSVLPPRCSFVPTINHAQVDVAPVSLTIGDFPKGGHGGASDSHLASSEDNEPCERVEEDVDARPHTSRVDMLAILQSCQQKVIILPSSPLPGWNTLPGSTMDARDSEDEDNLY